jgi:hypothetical protein
LSAASFVAVSAIVLIASFTDIEPVAAACRLVYTALENCGYQVGAPSGKTGLLVFSSSDSCSPSFSTPLSVSFLIPLSLDGRK